MDKYQFIIGVITGLGIQVNNDLVAVVDSFLPIWQREYEKQVVVNVLPERRHLLAEKTYNVTFNSSGMGQFDIGGDNWIWVDNGFLSFWLTKAGEKVELIHFVKSERMLNFSEEFWRYVVVGNTVYVRKSSTALAGNEVLTIEHFKYQDNFDVLHDSLKEGLFRFVMSELSLFLARPKKERKGDEK